MRNVFFNIANWDLSRHVSEFGRTLGEELLEPTRLYAKACLDLAANTQTHAMSHITGGGIAANIARVIPPGLQVTIERSTWTPAPVFKTVTELGSMELTAAEQALNFGIGMVAIIAPEDADRAIQIIAKHGIQAWVAGAVSGNGSGATLFGNYA